MDVAAKKLGFSETWDPYTPHSSISTVCVKFGPISVGIFELRAKTCFIGQADLDLWPVDSNQFVLVTSGRRGRNKTKGRNKKCFTSAQV